LLSDDPSLVYRVAITNHSVHFNIQQDEQTFRSYSLLRKSHEHPSMPYYVELSTPTHNYSSILSWEKSSVVSYRLFNKEDLISNGSGLYHYGLSSGLSVNLTEIYPKHMGQIDIAYDGNLSIHARECFGGEWRMRLERLPDWKHVRIDVRVVQTFLFLKEEFFTNDPSISLGRKIIARLCDVSLPMAMRISIICSRSTPR
jgi:hypothetical protein